MFWRAPLLHQRQKCQVKLAYTVAVFIMPPLVLPKLFFLSPSACVRSANSNFRSFSPFFFHLAQPKGSLQPRLVLGPGQLNYSILSDLSIQCVPFVYWIYRSVGWTHARSSSQERFSKLLPPLDSANLQQKEGSRFITGLLLTDGAGMKVDT